MNNGGDARVNIFEWMIYIHVANFSSARIPAAEFGEFGEFGMMQAPGDRNVQRIHHVI